MTTKEEGDQPLAHLHINLNQDWLRACRNFLKSRGEDAGEKQLLEQFLFSDMKESCRGFPCKTPPKCKKINIHRPFVLQVVSVLNIGQSPYQQYCDLTATEDDLSWFHGEDEDQDSAHVPERNLSSRHSGKTLQVEFTDGTSTFEAVEQGVLTCLTENTVPGTKVLMIPRLTARVGCILLDDEHCQVLGGEIEGDYDRRKFLADRVGMEPKRPSKTSEPVQQPKTLVPGPGLSLLGTSINAARSMNLPPPAPKEPVHPIRSDVVKSKAPPRTSLPKPSNSSRVNSSLHNTSALSTLSPFLTRQAKEKFTTEKRKEELAQELEKNPSKKIPVTAKVNRNAVFGIKASMPTAGKANHLPRKYKTVTEYYADCREKKEAAAKRRFDESNDGDGETTFNNTMGRDGVFNWTTTSERSLSTSFRPENAVAKSKAAVPSNPNYLPLSERLALDSNNNNKFRKTEAQKKPRELGTSSRQAQKTTHQKTWSSDGSCGSPRPKKSPQKATKPVVPKGEASSRLKQHHPASRPNQPQPWSVDDIMGETLFGGSPPRNFLQKGRVPVKEAAMPRQEQQQQIHQKTNKGANPVGHFAYSRQNLHHVTSRQNAQPSFVEGKVIERSGTKESGQKTNTSSIRMEEDIPLPHRMQNQSVEQPWLEEESLFAHCQNMESEENVVDDPVFQEEGASTHRNQRQVDPSQTQRPPVEEDSFEDIFNSPPRREKSIQKPSAPLKESIQKAQNPSVPKSAEASSRQKQQQPVRPQIQTPAIPHENSVAIGGDVATKDSVDEADDATQLAPERPPWGSFDDDELSAHYNNNNIVQFDFSDLMPARGSGCGDVLNVDSFGQGSVVTQQFPLVESSELSVHGENPVDEAAPVTPPLTKRFSGPPALVQRKVSSGYSDVTSPVQRKRSTAASSTKNEKPFVHRTSIEVSESRSSGQDATGRGNASRKEGQDFQKMTSVTQQRRPTAASSTIKATSAVLHKNVSNETSDSRSGGIASGRDEGVQKKEQIVQRSAPASHSQHRRSSAAPSNKNETRFTVHQRLVAKVTNSRMDGEGTNGPAEGGRKEDEIVQKVESPEVYVRCENPAEAAVPVTPPRTKSFSGPPVLLQRRKCFGSSALTPPIQQIKSTVIETSTNNATALVPQNPPAESNSRNGGGSTTRQGEVERRPEEVPNMVPSTGLPRRCNTAPASESVMAVALLDVKVPHVTSGVVVPFGGVGDADQSQPSSSSGPLHIVFAAAAQLQMTTLTNVLTECVFWTIPKVKCIQGICKVPEGLSTEGDRWILKIKVSDSSFTDLPCQVDPVLLYKLLGYSPAHTKEMIAKGREAEVIKCKEQAKAVSSALKRSDLILFIQFSPGRKSLPQLIKFKSYGEILRDKK